MFKKPVKNCQPDDEFGGLCGIYDSINVVDGGR